MLAGTEPAGDSFQPELRGACGSRRLWLRIRVLCYFGLLAFFRQLPGATSASTALGQNIHAARL
jgi:hypothetical protein